MAVQAIWNASIICNYFSGDCPPYLQSGIAMYSFSFVFSCIVSFCLCITSHFYVLFPKGRCFPSQHRPERMKRLQKRLPLLAVSLKFKSSMLLYIWVCEYFFMLAVYTVWKVPFGKHRSRCSCHALYAVLTFSSLMWNSTAKRFFHLSSNSSPELVLSCRHYGCWYSRLFSLFR